MEKYIKEVQHDFNYVIKTSQNDEISNPKTDELLSRWLKAKKFFIERFGGLIYEYPEEVYFELSNEEKDIAIDSFIDYVNIRGYSELVKFVEANRPTFFFNTVINDYKLSNGTVVPKGMKLVKAFKFFIDSMYELDKIQQKASEVIQRNKVNGKLCLSVHPLDFLSLSENGHNWRSCHALDGDYRAGNLSYMVDETTFICYLKSDKDDYLPRFGELKWNSKKWRVLLFLSDTKDFLTAGRQYPFSTTNGLNWVSKNLLPQFFGTWSEWMNSRITEINENGLHHFFGTNGYIPFRNDLLRYSGDIVVDEPGSLQFNDLISSSYYVPVYAYKVNRYNFFGSTGYTEKTGIMHPKIRVGGRVKCLRCEKEPIEFSSSMMCKNCEIIYGEGTNDDICYCPHCNERFYSEDGYWVGDDFICSECYNIDVAECAHCGCDYYMDDLYYSEKNDCYYCEWCASDLRAEGERI